MFFWWILWFFYIAAYLYVVILIITDLFRDHKASGWLKAVWIVFLAVFGGAGALILYKTLDGTILVLEMLFPVAGLVGFGFWIHQSIEKAKPGVYSPDALPRDLFP